MSFFHGTEDPITAIDERGFYVTGSRTAAERYGLQTADRVNTTGTAFIYTIALDPAAEIADAGDLREAIDAFVERENEEDRPGFDPEDVSTWEFLEFREVRDWLTGHGFDGARLDDTDPEGEDHETVLILNPGVARIAAKETITAGMAA